ncbi:hypothetical protein RHSIM_Rhsim09G0091800 [Rhododendron simsii]|uniref:Protein TIFY n=1 Tax=Rhododendron simsii TaxID=118357 RepID=A0A834GDK2_RHOSS|nr:hypothetical protein RHSIM_Rhsim09G0091800 [Rhododendron simsii]
MERDFMGLNSRDSVVVVKEEAVEGCKDSGVQWPLSNKVSAFPHFMSFKVAQEEKAPKATSDPVASSGYMTISTPDAFDATHKRQMQQVSIGQGGNHFSMTTYPEQHNAVSVHLSHDVKMAAANQPVSVSISNPLFTTHFLGAAQNFAGATAKQQYLGGTPIVAPHSISPSLGSVAGTTEPWFNSKSSGAPPQLTIFYAGTVNVYNDISPEKAQAIMFLAGNGSTPASKMAQPRAQAQVPVSIQAGGGDGVLINQRINTPTGSGLSSAMSSSHPVGQCGNGTTTNHELMGVKPTGAANSNPQNVVTSLGPAATIMTPSDLIIRIAMSTDPLSLYAAIPQARQASLARFLEKRKESFSDEKYLSPQERLCLIVIEMEDTVHTTAPLSGFVFPLNHLETFVLGDLFTAQEDLSVQMHFPKDNIGDELGTVPHQEIYRIFLSMIKQCRFSATVGAATDYLSTSDTSSQSNG